MLIVAMIFSNNYLEIAMLLSSVSLGAFAVKWICLTILSLFGKRIESRGLVIENDSGKRKQKGTMRPEKKERVSLPIDKGQKGNRRSNEVQVNADSAELPDSVDEAPVVHLLAGALAPVGEK